MPAENITSIQAFERDPLQDRCGIVAAYSKTPFKFFITGIAGSEKMQTRGATGVGECHFTDEGCIQSHKAKGTVSEGFTEDVVESNKNVRSKTWLFEDRYATNGDEKVENIQPITRRHKKLGVFAVVHNGQFSDQGGFGLNGESDTVVFANQLSYAEGNSWEEIVLELKDMKKGAASVAIATQEGIYLWRDEWGIRPFAYGKKEDPETGEDIWIAASETAALQAMGISKFKEVLPGMVIKLSDSGLEVLRGPSPQENHAACIFENVYIQNGGSAIHRSRKDEDDINYDPSVAEFRARTGAILAREENSNLAEVVDFACGIPGTGIAGCRAFAGILGIPYIQAISDRRPQEHDLRTFMIDNVKDIPVEVQKHFYIKGNYLKGAKVLIGDDSVVRGNISEGLVDTLYAYGALEVHIRVFCLPIDKPCHLGINTRTYAELIAHRHNGDTEGMRREIGATSLKFLSAEGLLEATGQENGFCLGCMVGHKPPIDKKGDILFI